MHKILVVENDNILRGCLKRILISKSFEVEEADSVEGAIKMMAFHKFDLIITDYLLNTPKDGLSFVMYLKNLGNDIPVIMMSATRSECIKRLAMTLGVSAFLEKPFGMEQFLKACEHGIQKEKAA